MNESKKKGPPGRKGGTTFPRITLSQAVEYGKKVVGKTHTGPQPESTILPGVFGSRTDRGKIRASALKQYGLLQGSKDAYSATELAKAIAHSPEDELGPLLQQACLRPAVFGMLYETFHGDTVSVAKLKQQAGSAGVHIEETERCAELFTESAVFAHLAQRNGDNITFAARGELVSAPIADSGSEEEDSETNEDTPESNEDTNNAGVSRDAALENARDVVTPGASARSVIHVNLTLDSSMDIDKLQKQLELLRRFGAI
jgi:hypothetical protein